MKSIRLSLLKWLILPLLAINLVASGLAYWTAWRPTQAAFDQSLADAAWSLVPSISDRNGGIEAHLSKQTEQFLRMDQFDMIFFTIRHLDGSAIAGDHDFPVLEAPVRLREPSAHDDFMRGVPVRVVLMRVQLEKEQVLIGVAETLQSRNKVRNEILSVLITQQLLLAVLFVVIAWVGVGIGLFPLQRMRAQLNTRDHDNLSQVETTDLPVELQPLAQALNGLLERTSKGKQAQQDFLANVAHQLRTPLSGLKTQLAWIRQRYAGDKEAAHSASMMTSSVDRMIRQTNQLLALARAEPSQFEKQRLETVELDKVVEESVQHFVQEADKKEIDLGFELRPTLVAGDRFLLRDLVDNLIDNAIRYSPPRATVTVRSHEKDGSGVLEVEDNGPGIAAADREKVFNRFYRLDDKVAGTGLGLAIVRDIAADHDATIEVQTSEGGSGTVVSVRFPLVRGKPADTALRQSSRAPGGQGSGPAVE
ncbi:sensor histidine kinase [Lacisediminimonas profundi]|uniref:sensor histidine kinase n=1 Tax=Lacisediminimonas profundi TaxID=2603856 RepID=UPI00124B4805|nr:sensor histidine kinase [Lacisediminimonas profundi]